MSYHEGSNWQAKKEDEKKPLYEPIQPTPEPIKKRKEGKYICSECDTLYNCLRTGCPKCKPQPTPEVIDFTLARQAVQTEIASNKEYEKYCQELETLWRDIDLILDFADPSDTQKIKMIKDKVHSFNKKIKL